jgi:hypothetical protein
VHPEIVELDLRNAPRAAYAAFDAAILHSAQPQSFVDAFKAVVTEERPFVRDLQRLLAFPTEEVRRDYLDPTRQQPGGGRALNYGWMPGFNNPTGDPANVGPNGPDDKQREPAMKPARRVSGGSSS